MAIHPERVEVSRERLRESGARYSEDKTQFLPQSSPHSDSKRVPLNFKVTAPQQQWQGGQTSTAAIPRF